MNDPFKQLLSSYLYLLKFLVAVLFASPGVFILMTILVLVGKVLYSYVPWLWSL